MPLSPSTIIGRYEILSTLGAGGMGEVYLAHDTRLNRKVALKVLPVDLTDNRERLHRFEQEAQAASALNHPNIITIHEIGEEGDTRFIAMEFIEGETLRRRLQTTRLKIEETLNIATQIAAALDAAHRSGIMHRDIKPENVMLREDGLVKVLDFGLAKLTEKKTQAVDSEAATRALMRTNPGVVMGTAAYMSPEQARGKEVDARTDIFSFGVLIYEMIAGRTPFAGDSMSETFANLINAEPPPLARYAANLPDEFQRIVAKTLRKNKDARYQTMKDVLMDLKDLRENLAFDEKLERSASPDNNATALLQAATGNVNQQTVATQNSVSQQIRRKLFAAVLLSVLLIGAIGFGFWYFANRAAGKKQIESIAVLPFENKSSDADTDYLSDGLAESLIYRLSQLPNLKVSPTSSVFRYKGKETDL